MDDARLPMTVIGGYLGAGKTTLINRLLSEPHGLRLMVLVNDFGAINIDAALLQSADEDTLTLTNGCVCCTMGSDLFMAIGDVLDRRPRPDHLIIEASGIANPAKIAGAAVTEPELRYGGIVTVVDALGYPELSGDPQIGQQLRDQVACADLVLVSKASTMPDRLALSLSASSHGARVFSCDAAQVGSLLLSIPKSSGPHQAPLRAHPDYVHWHITGDVLLSRQMLDKILLDRPEGLFRVKGFIKGPNGSGWLVQAVGRQLDIIAVDWNETTALVGIGLADQVSIRDCDDWWANALGIEVDQRTS